MTSNTSNTVNNPTTDDFKEFEDLEDEWPGTDTDEEDTAFHDGEEVVGWPTSAHAQCSLQPPRSITLT